MMLDLSAPLFCILLGAGSLIGWLLWKKHNRQFRFWLIPALICYILLLLKLTVFPIHIYSQETLDRMKAGFGNYWSFYQLIPFASIRNYFSGSGPIQLIGNLVLLSPLAVFAEIFLRQRPKAWKVALGTSAVSLLIEITQLVINLATRYPRRVPDVDDLILNIAGVVIAIILTRLIGKTQKIRKVLQKIFYH
jgi:glycopeptide antibiotics resistance protein